MAEITLDQAVLDKLTQFKGPETVRDANGQTVGLFTPLTVDHDLYRQIQVPITEEELDRREREPGGRTLEEILADLEKRQ